MDSSNSIRPINTNVDSVLKREQVTPGTKATDRQQKIARLREQVESGTYTVNMGLLAQKIHGSGVLKHE
jgi:anti-sigma28 factor (negative regulator of flagellin synthesis)